LLPWPTTSPFGKEPPKPVDIPIELSVYPALIGNGDPEEIANGCDLFNPYSSRFKRIREGDIARKSFKRLHRYRFSPTAWYGNQEVHLHPWKPRRLSVREALRIQSVPDEYIMPADLSLSAKFKMICNGVPCVMAFHLANSVTKFLKGART
jgi:DNA (cytosine-5)-methyltransferase 1